MKPRTIASKMGPSKNVYPNYDSAVLIEPGEPAALFPEGLYLAVGDLAQKRGLPLWQFVFKMLARIVKHAKYTYCIECGEKTWDSFMVRNRLWAEVVGPKGGYVHLNCLEERLGRSFRPEDFPDLPVNAGLHLGVKMGAENAKKPCG